jgi:hypothetical protein
METNTAERKVICPKCSAENLSWRSHCDKCGEDLHKNERGLPKFESRGSAFWIAVVSSVIGLLFLTFLAFIAAAFSGYVPIDMILMLVFPFVGLILCWRWPRTAGFLLIIGGVIPTVLILAFSGSGSVLGYLLVLLGITLPLLSSGIIFLMAGRS